MVQVYCKNTGTSKSVTEGTTLYDIAKEFDFNKPYDILCAKVNNVIEGLKFKVYNSRDVEFLDYRNYGGRSAYCRSLSFLLFKAVHDCFEGAVLTMRRPISKGFFCSVEKADGSGLAEGDLERIIARMKELVAKDAPFGRREARIEDAIELFRGLGYEDVVAILETTGKVYVNYYTLEGTPDYYYDCLVPSTGYLKVWDLSEYCGGLLLRVPSRHHPEEVVPLLDQPKTFEVFHESLRWNRTMQLKHVGDVNKAILGGHARQLIQHSEALHEKKIVQMAEEIERRYNDKDNPCRIVLITGPSSSGKSTVCRRLAIQLAACGLSPCFFSTDDYFVNRVDTPLNPDGSYDFDGFETVDHRMLEKDVNRLLAGEEVEIPFYNFVTGLREYNGHRIKLGPGKILLIEGIHALNPGLIPSVPKSATYRIFINTITSSSLDNHNCIPTSDNRLLRRIVRDANMGSFTARESITNWPNVRRSEVKWIYPYQETADALFNSTYLVEFAVLRNHAEQILGTVPRNCPEYSEASRLLKFLHYFTPVSDKEVPSTSLLREFISPR
ncbi:MAG: nucleoside kinase [Bacteroidales bacterium]|nr:nucleoside kinase [Bacteroidales bacterium]